MDVALTVQESIQAKQEFLKQGISSLESAIKLLWDVARQGRTILICGNGGSAADAQHFAAELVVRFKKNRPALPCIALTTDTSILTASANDFSYEGIFARQIEALGRKGDALVAISTSGTSKNVVLAAEEARKKGMKIVSLIGERPSPLEEISDVCIKAPSPVTARIQEVHELCLHIIAEQIEHRLIEEDIEDEAG